MDFINKLVEVYNRDANDDKNEVATKTAEFIDERIKIINGELGTTEQELETFKRDAGLTDLKSDAQLALVKTRNTKRNVPKTAPSSGWYNSWPAMPTIRIMPTKYFRSMWA